MIHQCMTILYVSDQEAARAFYSDVFDMLPDLHVPGMTEFKLENGFKFGLMPLEGIRHLLGGTKFSPVETDNPKAELYIIVDDAVHYLERAISMGAIPLLDVEPRDWGDRAGYCLDLDGHVLAFAESMKSAI